MTRRLYVPVPVVAVAVLVAGCGGGSSSSSSSGSGSGSNASSTSTRSAYGAAPSPAPKTTSAAVVSTRHLPLGAVLVGPDGRTLYLFQSDHGKSSTCTGPCAQGWPPLTTSGAPTAKDGAKASMLSTIKRADGSLQVAYAGHPLYYYVGDQQPGQANGQGSTTFGAGWYVVTPAGKEITGT